MGELSKPDPAGFTPPERDLERCLLGATAGDVVLLVQQCLRSGMAHGAVRLCERADFLGVRDPSLSLSEAMARFATGDRERARDIVDGVLRSSPESLLALHLKAHFAIASGRPREARALLTRVIDAYPDFPGAQGAVASLVFPGPHYREVLARFHARIRPQVYLEIGVESGASLALATTAEVALGIDPDPRRLQVPLPPRARTVALTSDEFFTRETPDTALGGRRVDFALIDGLHWYEQALRDFANVERWAKPGSTIVLHDCLPPTAVAARRERASTFWVGDTWKALECLLDYRPDLRIAVVPSPPSGLAVVRRLDPSSTVLRDRMEEIILRHRAIVEYPHVPGAWPERYGVVTNDAAGVDRALEG